MFPDIVNLLLGNVLLVLTVGCAYIIGVNVQRGIYCLVQAHRLRCKCQEEAVLEEAEEVVSLPFSVTPKGEGVFMSKFVSEKAPQSDDVKEALDTVQSIEDLIEKLTDRRHSDDAYDYFESVLDRAKSIGETIERNDRVSDKQANALTNMLEGVRKWDHGDD